MFFQVTNKTRLGKVVMNAKGLQPLEKYNNPSVIHCLGCHTWVMKWAWGTKIAMKSKLFITDTWTQTQAHSQTENSSHIKS